jgi:hypothetical protein
VRDIKPQNWNRSRTWRLTLNKRQGRYFSGNDSAVESNIDETPSANISKGVNFDKIIEAVLVKSTISAISVFSC